MWEYFGYELLFGLPIAGFIIILVFVFSSSNINLHNFARSYFCLQILELIVIALLLSVAGTAIVENRYFY